MRNKRKAKRILRAFGKESYKARIAYVNSFLPEKSSFIGSISYRHTLRRAAIVALVLIMVMALAVSAYAAVKHYMNYTKVVHRDNDSYIANSEYDKDKKVVFYEPQYVPERYTLISEETDESQLMVTWNYLGIGNDILTIRCGPDFSNYYIDNEHATTETLTLESVEVVVYVFDSFKICLFQYGDTVVSIMGDLSNEEIIGIIDGMIY